MAVLQFTELAILDLDQIFDRIAKDSLETAYQFTDELRDTCKALAEMPLMGRKRDELRAGVRSLAHHGYTILYQEIEGGVLVERVASPGRNVGEMFEQQ